VSAVGEWTPPPQRPRLVADGVDVWCAQLDDASADDALAALLSDGERARAARFARAAAGRRWATARGILRSLLGAYAGADPRALRFALGEHGKPSLAAGVGVGGEATGGGTTDGDASGGGTTDRGATGGGAVAAAAGDAPASLDVRFNLSHSGDVALYAFALGREIGVDVELLRRPLGDVAQLAARVLGDAEAERLRAIEAPDVREREFLRVWTRHEAATKCRGTGIGAAQAAAPDAPPLWIVDLDPGPRGAAALALDGPSCELRRWRWA
jgi:4'-phosphopantetheinyl transferase